MAAMQGDAGHQGGQQHHPGELDDDGRLHAFGSAGRRRSDHLADVVDAGADPVAIGDAVEPDEVADGREDGDRQAAAQGDEGDREGHLLLLGVGDILDRGDGRRPTDREPRGDEQRHPTRQAEPPSRPLRPEERGRDRDCDDPEATDAECGELGQRQLETEQHHPGAEDALRRELHAGADDTGGPDRVRVDRAQRHGDDQWRDGIEARMYRHRHHHRDGSDRESRQQRVPRAGCPQGRCRSRCRCRCRRRHGDAGGPGGHVSTVHLAIATG